ncbi:MAG: DUF3467 domain-containing protein [Bacteroidetes bacterium]|nr:DUF3467 domain-containing protein [Bacteroidota bacterium]MCY4205056.1 DUF3467 domain-containing protein [Bacteroidota bacterium]
MEQETEQLEEEDSKLNVELNENVAEGEYSNLVMIGHSREEFILDFIRVMPGVPAARVKSRIIITPRHAKRFLHALAENIERFEDANGEISDSERPDLVQFGSGHIGEA